jgi:pectate lyase
MKKICTCIFFLLVSAGWVFAIPAFPGAEGFGKNAIGGRGGTIYEVTNLSDSGAGSLRAAVTANGPRIVVFRVSGTIQLLSDLEVSKPYITIAGQTAPGDGICLRDHNFQIKTSDVIVRYIRFRLGDESLQEEDTVTISSGHNIILDHCSASWSVDETLSTDVDSNVMGNLTVQWCMITESLNCSIHSKGCHGYGSLLRGCYNNGYSFHHNLYAHHMGRSPRPGNYNSYTVDPCGLILDLRNNVFYNWDGGYSGYNDDTTTVVRMNLINNYYKRGPNSDGNYAYREKCTYSRAYFSGNMMNGVLPTLPWTLMQFSGFTTPEMSAYRLTAPLTVPEVTTDDANTAYALVLADAGASFPVRDTVDTRVMSEVANGTGSIIDDEDEVGGWPVLASTTAPADSDHDGMPDEWELAVCLNPNDPADRNYDRDSDGYTNVEEYINRLPSGAPMPANTDTNCDGIVDFYDFTKFAGSWYSVSGSPLYKEIYDFNHNDMISLDDLFFLVQDWLLSGQEY